MHVGNRACPMKNHLDVIVLLSQRQINSPQSAHFHFTNFTRFNVLLWYYTNTENFGIRPSQYRYWYTGFRDPGIGIPIYGVSLLLRPYAMQFGELREVGESYSSYNPGLGPRFLIIAKYSIAVSHRNSLLTLFLNIIILVWLRLHIRHAIIRYQRRQL